MDRVDILRLGTVAANSTSIKLERNGDFEQAEGFRQKADKRLARQRQAAAELSVHRRNHGC